MGTFCGLIIEDMTNVSSTPIWGDCLGIVIGCLLGIMIPKLLMGDKSNLAGINKVNPSAVFLGDMNEDQLVALVEGKHTILHVRAYSTFKKLDSNNSNSLDLSEVKSYLMSTLGEQYSEDTFNTLMNEFFNVNLDGNPDFNFEEFKII